MNYGPLGQGLAGAFLLAHASFLWAAASDAIIVESRSESLLVLPTDSSANPYASLPGDNAASVADELPASAASLNAPVEAPQSAVTDVTEAGVMRPSAMRPSAELLPFQAPTDDGEMAGIEVQYQQQILQQEVQTLRGLVEELQFQLQRMKKTQDDRYLDLDGRFQALRGSGQTSGAVANNANTRIIQMPESAGSRGAVTGDTLGSVSTATTVADALSTAPLPTGQSEKDLYDTALELIRNRQYDVAITQLQAVVDRYPAGDYAPNAYYWLGEVYAARPQPDLEKARQALAQVISSYPGHRKVPDAAFKLGKVHHLMGDCDKSRDMLSRIADEQQGKTVGKLAASYLRDSMVDCQS
ncbi:MAG: tol-pal system protein YbgF [Cyclobacteriaceae bacterium]|jgi:tol-pal system protein YbgF